METQGTHAPPAGTRFMAVLRWLLVVAMAGAAVASIAWYAGWLAPASATAQEWTCPMHPTYVADKPGQCPICGMDLVPKSRGQAARAHDAAGGARDDEGFRLTGVQGVAPVTIATDRLQRIGLRHEPARMERWQQQVRAPAVIQADEAAVFQVHPHVAGWVQSESGKRPGDPVRAREVLATIYSHELHQAQAEFLSAGEALQGLGGGAGVHQAAAARLRVLGMTDAAIRKLGSSRTPDGKVVLTSPRDGVVMERRTQPGQYVTEADALFVVGDLTSVLVLAEVPLGQGAELAVGQEMQVAVEELGEETATVLRVEPVASGSAQALRVRAVLRNPDGRWRPGLVGEVRIAGVAHDALTVPAEAVVDTGLARYVHRLVGTDRFVPTRVQTGMRQGDRIEILAGLRAGDEVVTSGNFLIDAESRIAAGQDAPMAEMPGMGKRMEGSSIQPHQNEATGAIGKDYLDLQEALVAADAVAAGRAAASLARSADPQVASAASSFPGELEAQRKHFKALSEAVILWAATHPNALPDAVVARCPMADGRWLQAPGQVRNPYYGEQMLHCGVIQGPPGEAP